MVGIDFKQQRFLCFKNIYAEHDVLFVCNISISRVDIVRFQVTAQAVSKKHFKGFTEFLVSWKYSVMRRNICCS